MESRETVFKSVAESEFNHSTFTRDNAISALGYQREIPEEIRVPLRANFTDFFNRTVICVEDWDNLLGGERKDSSREVIQPPPFSILEKDGNYYYEIQFGSKLTLITEAKPKTVLFKYFERFEGLPIEHVLVSGDDETVIDLTSIVIGAKAENLLSFSDRNSGRVPPRRYKPSEDRVLEYGPNVLFCMPVEKGESEDVPIWAPDSAIYLYLHENAHQSLSAAGVENDSMYRDEREANALVLNLTRRILRTFPKARYLDATVHRNWIEKQLAEGYDKRMTEADLHKSEYSMDDIATNKLRAVNRKIRRTRREK